MGNSQRILVVFDGLDFSHKPQSARALRMMPGFIKPIADAFTVYLVRRRPGLPAGYSIRDMSNDYANMIRNELRGPVDIMGISTGGPMAQYFAVDHHCCPR
jgi:hypothetical protein